jgi:hypothetical protein
MELLTQQFISFMTAASGGTNLQFQLQTYDLLQNVTFTLAITGLSGNETTFQLGNIVSTQFTTYLAQTQMLYPNVPPLPTSSTIAPFLAFPDQSFIAMFNVTWTEHVVDISGQCNFSVSTIANTTNSYVNIDSHPILLDYPTLVSNNPGWNLLWEDQYGNIMPQNQIIQALDSASSEMVNYLRSNVVLTTYLHNEIADGGDSANLEKTPIRDFFAPVIRRPSYYNITQTGTLATIKSNYEPDRTRGILTYRFAQPLVDAPQPFDRLNEVMIAYIAGYQKIPLAIKKYTAKLAMLGDNQYAQMQGEGSRFNIRTYQEILQDWGAYLESYGCV